MVSIKKGCTFAKSNQAGIAQLVERNLAKVEVAGPSPVSRSFFVSNSKVGLSKDTIESTRENKVALVVELVDTRDLKSREQCALMGSSPIRSTNFKAVHFVWAVFFIVLREYI